MAKQIPTQARVKELLNYDPETGVVSRKISVSPNARAGDVAGCIGKNGYWQVQIDGLKTHMHRIVWLYVYGDWPDGDIDHVNGDRSDNRLINLRNVTHQQNTMNRTKSRRNKSGFKGVCRGKGVGTWRAFIHLDGVSHNLGTFKSIEDAISAREAGEHMFFAEFRRK